MGNNESSTSLPTNFIRDKFSRLRQFNIFGKYPKDRTKADFIISNVVTNTLKYADSIFASQLGGHCKR